MLKKFEDLTLQDDFMFCKVMQNPDLCKRLIEMKVFIAKESNVGFT